LKVNINKTLRFAECKISGNHSFNKSFDTHLALLRGELLLPDNLFGFQWLLYYGMRLTHLKVIGEVDNGYAAQ
jgi:hypothetical protein